MPRSESHCFFPPRSCFWSFRCPEPVERAKVASGFVRCSTSSTHRKLNELEGGRRGRTLSLSKGRRGGGFGACGVCFDTLRQARRPSSTGRPLSRRRGEGCKNGPQIILSDFPDSLPFTRRGRLNPIRLLSSPPPLWGRARERGKLQLPVTEDTADKGSSLCMDSCFRRNDESGA